MTLYPDIRLTPNEPIKIGVWASDGNNYFFLKPVFERLPERYEVKWFPWTPQTPQKLLEQQIQSVDLVWFEWGNHPVIEGSRLVAHVPAVCRIHRYEAYTNLPRRVVWKNIDALVLVSHYVRAILNRLHGYKLFQDTSVHVIPNGVDVHAIPFNPDRGPGFNIGFLGRLHWVKNPMLWVQVLKQLVDIDDRYRMHVVGGVQQIELMDYINYQLSHLGLQDHVIFHQHLPHDKVLEWIGQMNYLITTSIIEGHPVGVMEAMAAGVKSVIHDFPGARDLFPENLLWNSISQAVELIREEAYDPAMYRAFIQQHYSLEHQVQQVVALLDKLVAQYYPERIGNSVPSTTTNNQVDSMTENMPAADPLKDVREAIAQQNFAEALRMLETIPFDTLQEGEALEAHAIAMQLYLNQQNYTAALEHGDAALQLNDEEPAIYHALGQALWETGHEEAAAEAWVYAAELLDRSQGDGFYRLPVDPASVYLMAGEACRMYGKEEEARRFFERVEAFQPGYAQVQTSDVQEAVIEAPRPSPSSGALSVFPEEVQSTLTEASDVSSPLEITVGQPEETITYVQEVVTQLVQGKQVIDMLGPLSLVDIQRRMENGTWWHDAMAQEAALCMRVTERPEVVPRVENQTAPVLLHEHKEVMLPSELQDRMWDYLVVDTWLSQVDHPVQVLQHLREQWGSHIRHLIVIVPHAFSATNMGLVLEHRESVHAEQRYWFSPYTLAKVLTRAGYSVEGFRLVEQQKADNEAYEEKLREYPLLRENLLMVAHFHPLN